MDRYLQLLVPSYKIAFSLFLVYRKSKFVFRIRNHLAAIFVLEKRCELSFNEPEVSSFRWDGFSRKAAWSRRHRLTVRLQQRWQAVAAAGAKELEVGAKELAAAAVAKAREAVAALGAKELAAVAAVGAKAREAVAAVEAKELAAEERRVALQPAAVATELRVVAEKQSAASEQLAAAEEQVVAAAGEWPWTAKRVASVKADP